MEIKNYLVEQQGFNPYNSEVTQKLTDCTWRMFRRTKIETDKKCLCNDKPPQIGVYFYSIEIQGISHKSYQVEVVQENDLGWIKFEYYGVDEDHLIKNFDKIERSLIRAWEASWCEEI